MDRRLCLITGASAGIGAEFARQYAALGWDVALTARRADRLDALAAELQEKYRITAIVIAEDLAKKSAPAKILAALEEKGRHVDALVNNAGYGLPGTFFSTSWKEQGDFIQVLYTAPIELAHRVLPGMAERGYGRIINVASLAGYAAGSAGHTLYASVKAGMIKFSESLNAECEALGHKDIHCTALCPGFTWSEFHDANGTREQTNRVYVNDGHARFAPIELDDLEADTYGIATGDMDGDGLPDLVFANSGAPNLVMLSRVSPATEG